MPGSPPAGADGPRAKGRAPHRRRDRARVAVLHAADDLLVERGYAGVTIEGIAARAGVAKQTIYRWWPSKFEILMDTFLEDAAGALEIPDTGTVDGDLRQHLRQLAGFLSAEPAGRVMLALIGEAQHDADVARTDLRSDTDLDLVIDMIYGPVYHRVLLTGLPVDDRFIDGLVSHVMAAIAAPGRAPAS